MRELSFAQSFSLIALNTQDSKRMTTEKKMILRGIAAATLLELYLDGLLPQSGSDFMITKELLDHPDLTLYQNTVLRTMLGSKPSMSHPLNEWLKTTTKMSDKQLKAIERNMVDFLMSENLLDEIPSLFSCDLEIVTAGLSLYEYRSQPTEYTHYVEALRADALEEGNMNDETILLLWVLKESCILRDLFSNSELEQITSRLYDLYHTPSFIQQILVTSIHQTLENVIKSYLNLKTAFIKTPIGTGINFMIPVLERSGSVFIETEAWFSNSSQRLHDLKTRLESQGHQFTITSVGDVPLLKIDNVLYEAIPEAVVYNGFPIHGVRLRRYPL